MAKQKWRKGPYLFIKDNGGVIRLALIKQLNDKPRFEVGLDDLPNFASS